MNGSSAAAESVGYVAGFGGLALACGLLVVLMSAMTPTWLAFVLLGAVTATAIAWSNDATTFLLCGLVLTAPIIVTKAIVTTGGVYAPGLEVSISDLFLLALFAAWLVRRAVVSRRRTTPVTGLWVAGAYLAWCWIGAMLSSDLMVGSLAALNATKLFVTFTLVADLASDAATLRRVLAFAGIGMALQIGMGAAQFLTGSELQLQGAKVATLGTRLVYADAGGVQAFRPSGFSLHPNVFAAYLVMLLPTPLLLLLTRSVRRPLRIACAALVLGGAAVLMATLSRGGWVSFAGATAFLAVMGCRMRLLRVSHIALAGVLVGLLAAVVAVVYPTAYYRILYRDDRATEARVAMLSQAMMIIRDAPVLGVGYGGYNAAAQDALPPSFGGLSAGFRQALLKGVVHHKYALVWAEQGVVGLLLLIAVFATFVRAFVRVRLWCDPVCAVIGLGLVAGIVAQLIFYNFDHFYSDSRPNVLWIVFGLLAGLLRFNERAVERPRLLSASAGVEEPASC
jgi:O-antigen ligase